MPFTGQYKISWKDCGELEQGVLKPRDLPENVIPTNKEVYNAYLLLSENFWVGADDALAERIINQVPFCFKCSLYVLN